MDIIEDLNLIDFPDDLDLDFDLDDILMEFSTPGLFGSSRTLALDDDSRSATPDIPATNVGPVFEDAAESIPSVTVAPVVAATCRPLDDTDMTVAPPLGDAAPASRIDDDVPVFTPASAEPREELPTIGELLYEFGMDDLDDEGVKVYGAAAAPDEDEDVRVYTAPAASAPSDTAAPETVRFGAVQELDITPTEDVQAPARPDALKGPGLLTRLAGMVMGLFASKNKAVPVGAATCRPQTTAEPDPFAGMEDLFAAQEGYDFTGDDGVDPALMLELELQAEREAELAANAAAETAHDTLLNTPDPEFVVPVAVLEVQQEQEAAILAAEEAEADPAILTAEEEEELFDWLEAANARRAAASRSEDAPAPVETATCRPLDDADTLVAPPVEDPESASRPDESAYTVPVYDPALIIAEEESPEGLMPELSIDDEDVEIVEPEALLETPDATPHRQEESPAEAAARRAKEDDELRYVPEETPAELLSSRLNQRLGGLFGAFLGVDNDPGDSEEALGEEVPPSKAYRYFNKYINGYRFRMRVSVVLSVILGWISLGLPVFGSLNNPAVAAAACLMALLCIMLAGADILAIGFRSILRRKPGLHGVVTLSCLASVIDAVAIILSDGAGGYLPFCAVSGISMTFAIYGSLLYCRSQRLAFKSLEQAAEPMTISVDYGIVDEETTTAYRTPGHPEQFIHRSEEEDLSETLYGILGPVLLVAVPVLALIAALLGKHLGDFFHIMAAMFAASASFGAMVAFPLPYFLVQRDLYAAKAAVAGWTGTREIGRVATMIVTDRDLFPDETVSISSVRIVDNVPPDLTLSYICSLIYKSNSCLVPAFIQLAENNDCELRPVEDFQCHEAGGLSGNIGPDHVLVASHSYMKLQGFRIPARKKDSENALFLAVNGHVIAYIMVDYKPIKSVRAGLESAIAGSAEMVFAARDFNITPMLITKKFKSPTDTFRFPSFSQRYAITDHSNSDTATCAAVVSRKSFYSYAMVVEKARNLYNSVTWAVILSALSTLLGVLLMFVTSFTGAVSVTTLLIFMLLFAVATLAISVSITK